MIVVIPTPRFAGRLFCLFGCAFLCGWAYGLLQAQLRLLGLVLEDQAFQPNDPEGTYRSADGQFTYSLSGNNLTVRDAAGGSISIEDYGAGALGIQLSAPVQQRTGQAATNNPYGALADNWDLFQNMRTLVAQKHAQLGVLRSPEEIDRIAAAITFNYHEDRMEGMAHLQPSVDSNQRPHLNGSLVAYEKYPPTFVTNHSATNIGQALQTPVQESFNQLAKLQQDRQREEQLEVTKVQTPGYEHPSLRNPGNPQGPTIG